MSQAHRVEWTTESSTITAAVLPLSLLQNGYLAYPGPIEVTSLDVPFSVSFLAIRLPGGRIRNATTDYTRWRGLSFAHVQVCCSQCVNGV